MHPPGLSEYDFKMMNSEGKLLMDMNVQYFSFDMSHVIRKLFLPYANTKGADQPAHPRSLISAFVVHCLNSRIPLVSIAKVSSL